MDCDGGSAGGSARGRVQRRLLGVGGGQELGCSNLTSAEVGGFEELHILVAVQLMRAWTRWELGRTVGDADGAKVLNKEASGVASHQDTSLELAQQALGGSLQAGLGKYHLLHVAVGAGGLGHQAAVQALHLGLAHHVPIVDEGEHQGVVCGQRATDCTKCLSPRGHTPGQHSLWGNKEGLLQIQCPRFAAEEHEAQTGNQARAGEDKGCGAGTAATPPEFREGPVTPHPPAPQPPRQGASCPTSLSLVRVANNQFLTGASRLNAQGLTVYKKIREIWSFYRNPCLKVDFQGTGCIGGISEEQAAWSL